MKYAHLRFCGVAELEGIENYEVHLTLTEGG